MSGTETGQPYFVLGQRIGYADFAVRCPLLRQDSASRAGTLLCDGMRFVGAKTAFIPGGVVHVTSPAGTEGGGGGGGVKEEEGEEEMRATESGVEEEKEGGK
eukprot:336481-Rhodomonas_salina.2